MFALTFLAHCLSALIPFFYSPAQANSTSIEWILPDRKNPGLFLLKKTDGALEQVRISPPTSAQAHSAQVTLLVRWENTDKACGIEVKPWERMEWASPHLSFLQSTCRLSHTGSEPRIVRLPDNQIPTQAYTVAYFGEDQNADYFALAARPLKSQALIYLKAVPKSELTPPRVLTLVHQIPGYSGAMALDPSGENLLYTEASGEFLNRIYRLPLGKLLGHAATAKPFTPPLVFGQISQSSVEFPGLGLWLSAGNQHLLYGQQNDPLLLTAKTGQALALPEPPHPSCHATALGALPNREDFLIWLCPEWTESPLWVQSLHSLPTAPLQ